MATNDKEQAVRIVPEYVKKVSNHTYPGYVPHTFKGRVNYLLSKVLDENDGRSLAGSVEPQSIAS